MAQGEILNKDAYKSGTNTATDYSSEDQPEGLASYALNVINQTTRGDKGKRSTEQSNSISGTFTFGYVPIGRCYINNGRSVIFLVSLDESTSEIGIVDKNSIYTPTVNANLGFKLNKQIQALYRLRLGCEDVIYFTDGSQSMRNFNFARPQDYYTIPYLNFLNNNSTGTFTGDIWDAEKFNLFSDYKVPSFSSMSVITGGSIIPGTYNFSIRYLDDDLNPTNWIYNSQLVPIYQSDTGGSYFDITGSSNILNDSISGIPNTNKSIKINLDNLDPTYKFYQIAIIAATTGNGQVTSVLSSPTFLTSQKQYLFDGNVDGYSKITSEELAIGKIDIATAQHIEQIENRLILANIGGKQVPYCTFQQSASKIVTNYIISESEDVDPTQDGNSKDPNTYWDTEGYMGDEVYALGVVYVFNDGLETPSFHIPGRSPSEYVRSTDQTIQRTTDQDIITSWNSDLSPWFTDSTTYNALPTSQKLRRWQVYDTSVKYSSSEITNSYGAMSYWQNQDAFYTNFSDCTGEDFWGTDACGIPLANTPIRHHKFPSRYKEPHVRDGSVFIGSTGLFLDVALNSGQVFPSGGLTISVSYLINGLPNVYNSTITNDELPVERFLIDQYAGDFNTITIVSVTGTLTDTGNSAITTYNVYRDVLSSSSVNGSILRNLGIKFSNITYPHPDIVGHYFVRGARDLQNRTVLDKGFAGNLSSKTVNDIDYTGFAFMTENANPDPMNNYLITPRFLFNKESLIGDYLKYENEFVCGSKFVVSNTVNGTGSIFKELDTVIEIRSQFYDGVVTTNGDTNYKVNKSIILDATGKNTTFFGTSKPLYNLSWSNRLHVVNTQTDFPNPSRNIPYVGYKIDQNVHPDLSNITYQRIHNSMLTLNDDNIVFGGDTFISLLNFCNSLYRTQKKGFLTTLLSIILIAAAVVITIATSGLTASLIGLAIGAAAIAGIAEAVVVTALVAGLIGVTGATIQLITSEMEGDLGQLTDDTEMKNATGKGLTLSSYVAYSNEFMQALYVESEVNVGLRQTENHICGNFFTYDDTIQDYFKNRWMYFDQKTNAYQPKGYACPEVYHYNLDYSRQNLQSQYFPLPPTYDCCSDCAELHPNRTQYSEQSFQEELTDNYKIFLPNNYVDIEAEHGEITDVFKRNNNLFVQTSEAIWMLPESQQEKVTDELVTYIGTGEFFSIPVKKIIDSELGSGGSQHKWATLSIDSGALIVNELEGKIYLFNQNFSEISKEGHQRWFKENLRDFFARQFQLITSIPFPNINNPANPHGVGIHSVYDKRYNRLIITKRDYLLLPAFISAFRVVTSSLGLMPSGLTSGQLVFDLTTNKFVVSAGSPSSYSFTEFTNPHYFQNKSWTMSYSLEENEQGWVSWHSYLPNFYFYNHQEFYSTIFSSNSIWKHNTPGSWLSFYGKQYPHIIEVILKNNYTMSERYGANTSTPIDTRFWDDISLQTIAKSYNSDNDDLFDERYITFNKFIAYNSRQTTGLQLLIVKDEIDDVDFMSSSVKELPVGQIFNTRKERDWSFNSLRDYRSDYTTPIFTKVWSAIYPSYPIDKILDISTIDFNKDWSQLEILRDKFLTLRLIFDNFTDVQLTTNYILDTSGESIR